MRPSAADFSALREINPDTVGWIRLFGTPIDYPIVQERLGDHYLRHNFSGEESRHGSVCLDMNSPMVFPDRRNRLRGHNMSDGSMFRALTGYLEPEFFAAHPAIEIDTPQGGYTASVWAAIRVPYEEEALSIVPADPLGFEAWRCLIEKRSRLRGSIRPTFFDQNIVFCTCETEGADGLAHGDVLVFAVLRPREPGKS